MNCGIYMIQNTVNGKAYIGSSQNLRARIGAHKRQLRKDGHGCARLQHAWNLDGEEAFIFKTVLVCSRDNLLMYEQALIDGYKAWLPEYGYNIARHAYASFRGMRHTDATKKLMSEKRMGVEFSEEHKQRLSEWQRGKPKGPRDPAVMERIASARRGKPGRKLTEQERNAIGDRQRGKTRAPFSDEHRAKIAAARANQVFSEEAMLKRSESIKAAWARRKAREAVSQDEAIEISTMRRG